jgi:hypothetical protein
MRVPSPFDFIIKEGLHVTTVFRGQAMYSREAYCFTSF